MVASFTKPSEEKVAGPFSWLIGTVMDGNPTLREIIGLAKKCLRHFCGPYSFSVQDRAGN